MPSEPGESVNDRQPSERPGNAQHGQGFLCAEKDAKDRLDAARQPRLLLRRRESTHKMPARPA